MRGDGGGDGCGKGLAESRELKEGSAGVASDAAAGAKASSMHAARRARIVDEVRRLKVRVHGQVMEA